MLFRQLFDAESSTYLYLLADSRTRAAVLIDPAIERWSVTLRSWLDLELRAQAVCAFLASAPSAWRRSVAA